MATKNKSRLKISKSKATRLRLAAAQTTDLSPEAKAKDHFRAFLEEFEPHNISRQLREIRANVMLEQLQNAYKEIKNQHQLILSIIESLPSAVVITDGPEHTITLINQYSMGFLGSDAVGKSWKNAVDDSIYSPSYKTLHALDVVYQTGLPKVLPKAQYFFEDGSSRTWDFFFYPLFKKDKEIRGVVFYAVETTTLELALQQKQELLSKVEEQKRTFNSLVESISDGLLLIGRDLKVVFANQPVTNLLGFSPSDVIEQSFSDIIHQIAANIVQPENAETQLIEAVNRRNLSPVTLELRYKLPENDQILDLRFAFFDVIDPETNLIGQGCLISDITRQKEIDRLKSQFISTVSHEMRTPLTGIFGYLELMLHHKPDEALHMDWLNKIYHEVLTLNRLIDELLDLSRIEAGRLELYKEQVQLEKLVADALTNMERFISKEKHQIKLEIDTTLPSISADRNKILRVFSNLIQNAFKYSPDGGLIEIKLKSDASQILVSVRDEGMGIAEEEQTQIFERFYRTHESQQRKIRGNGLGLSIVKSIVELHQGSVWLESKPQQGSTFYFTLPIS